MILALTLFMLLVPLLLFALGFLTSNPMLVVVGSIGMIVCGVVVFADAPEIENLANSTEYTNSTTNVTTTTFNYSSTPVSDNVQLIIGSILALMGIGGMAVSAVSMRD